MLRLPPRSTLFPYTTLFRSLRPSLEKIFCREETSSNLGAGTNSLWEGRPIVDRGSDRKSTRLNSSHITISYAVFCLKKKKNNTSYKTIKILQHIKIYLSTPQ